MNEKMNLTKILFIILTFASGVIFGLYINLFTKEPKQERIILNEQIICKNLETMFKNNLNQNAKSKKQLEKEVAINRMLRN
jgi:hypothetical protein